MFYLIVNVKAYIEKLAAQSGEKHINYTSIDLGKYCTTLDGPPDEVALTYFSQLIPVRTIDRIDFVLFGKDRITSECRDLVPGCKVSPFGFVPVASRENGDIFCLDCSTGRVFEISHEKYEGDKIFGGWNFDFSDFLPNLPITRKNIIVTSINSINSIEVFLRDASERKI